MLGKGGLVFFKSLALVSQSPPKVHTPQNILAAQTGLDKKKKKKWREHDV